MDENEHMADWEKMLLVFGDPQNPGIADIRHLLSSSPPLVAVAKETIQQSEDVMNPQTSSLDRMMND